MGLDLAVGLSKMLRPSEAGEMAMVGFLILLGTVFAGAGYFVWKKKQADSSPLPESGYGQLGP